MALRERYRRIYSAEPRVFRAPGSVNIIGDHAGHDGGFALPCAIRLYTRVVAHPGETGIIAQSGNSSHLALIDLEEPNPEPQHDWSDPIRGIATRLRQTGHPPVPANLLIQENIPAGAGLGSEASLQVAAAFALLEVAGLELSRTGIARLCQQVEERFAGIEMGMVDPFACCHGRDGHAIFLDCRSLEHHYVPIPAHVSLLVCDTMVRRSEAAAENDLRRRQCGEGVQILSATLPGVTALRDVVPAQLEKHQAFLGETIYSRCRHVVEENERVVQAGIALLDGNLRAVGDLMNASHESMRRNYDVSCPELDLMVNLARECKGVYGARLIGPGFGGSILCLADVNCADAIARSITNGYRAQTGIRCDTWLCSSAEGAGQEMI